MKLWPLLLLAASPVAAGQLTTSPAFIDRSGALPSSHVYAGGWEHFVGGGVAVFDCNGDARPDFYAAGGENPARLFVNETTGPGAPLVFRDGAVAALTGVTGAYPLDIDGDSLIDLVVLRVGPNVVLRGDGACGFADVTSEWAIDPGDHWTTAFTATWEGDRTRPTLVFGNYVDRADPDGPFEACDVNQFFRPEGGAYSAPVELSPGFCALSMLISDWTRGGEPELRISNDRHYYVRNGHEEMWRLEPLSPRTEADGWDKVSLWGMGIASADITGDGLPEVMLTSMGDQLLQFNDGGRMRNAPFEFGTYAHRPHVGDDGRPSTGWHAEFGDIDNDGRLDLFLAKGNVDQMPSNAIHDPNNLLMQAGDGTFREVAVEAGIATGERSRGAALADFDGDGRLDIVVVNRRAPLEVWQNTTPAGNWASVELRDEGPNTRGVGAWLELRTGDGVQAREVTVGGGHAGGQAGPIHFGVGAAGEARLRILWPDGEVTDWMPLPINRRVTVGRAGLIPG
jgi:enediyne biosynthesis protein E4